MIVTLFQLAASRPLPAHRRGAVTVTTTEKVLPRLKARYREEIAEALKIHPNTVMRDWSAAKAWLYAALSGEEC